MAVAGEVGGLRKGIHNEYHFIVREVGRRLCSWRAFVALVSGMGSDHAVA